MTDEEIKQEGKRKFAWWVRQSTIDLIQKIYKLDNCSSQSEFIEKAVLFYAGYLSAEYGKEYIPGAITSTLKSIVSESDNRISRLLFKMAVELAVAMNVIAACNNLDKESLDRLRGECVKEVKKVNGSISFDKAAEWQQW